MLSYHKHTLENNRFDKQAGKQKQLEFSQHSLRVSEVIAADSNNSLLGGTGSGGTVIMLPKPKPHSFFTILFCRITAPAEHIMSNTLLIKIM